MLIAASVLCLSFWVTEAWYKVIQNGHFKRVKELEDALQNDKEIVFPRIYEAYIEKFSDNRKGKKWLKMMFYPQVMFPHVFVLSLIVLFLVVSPFRS